MWPRCPSTVRSDRKSAVATSLFVLPRATSAATRSSAGVRAPGAAARPLMRFSSARARSAQSAAPIPSKTASACSSVARASRRRFSRRCVAPSASSVRPRSSGSSTCACRSSAVANAASAASSSPACAARSPRQRAQLASAEMRSSRRAFASYQSRSSVASRRRPSSTSASTWSTTNRVAPGSTIPSRRTNAVCEDRCSTTSFGRSSERARSPRAADAIEDEVPVRARLDHICRSLPGGFRPAALCLSEALERACAQREQEQTRLLSGLVCLASASDASLDVSDQQLEVAEEDEEPGPRALVTQLIGRRARDP